MRLAIIRFSLILVLFWVTPAVAVEIFPLEPPDTSNPRATFKSFMDYSNQFYQSMHAPRKMTAEAEEALERAEGCFDLSEVPPSIYDDVALESVLRLREILDRIDLPALEAIPGPDELLQHNGKSWRIPHTEIKIGRSKSNPEMFLFTPQTVDRLDEFYEEVRNLPYKDGAAQGIYEEYIYSAGWLVPDDFISQLPQWMRKGYLGQAVWQWIGLLLSILAGIIFMIPWYIWDQKRNEKIARRKFERALFPILGMCVCLALENIINNQINITGHALAVTIMGMHTIFILFSVWTIMVIGNAVPQAIISAKHIREEALNADVIKLVCQLISLSLVFVLLYRTGSDFGLPVTAVFASAGIVGVAVALAARETLANFFGGVSIFLDRPFRAGDYIVLESGERGEVQAVGIRSTRLVTRDGILITIPNSVITNVKIVNQSAPHPDIRVRIKIGVAYDSDLDKVEMSMKAAATEHPLVKNEPAPAIRLLSLEDSAILYELRAWGFHPKDKSRLVHELSRDILRRFAQEGIEIPFPQLDVNVRSNTKTQA